MLGGGELYLLGLKFLKVLRNMVEVLVAGRLVVVVVTRADWKAGEVALLKGVLLF